MKKNSYNTRLRLDKNISEDRMPVILSTIETAANQHLKLRTRKSGKGVVIGEIVTKGNPTIINLRIPFDSRYKQKPEDLDKFNRQWSKSLHSRLGVMSGDMYQI